MGETRSRGDGANVPALWCADARSSTLAVPFPCQVRMTLNPDRRGAITQLAQRWSAGEETAFEELIDLVYDDLRKIARSHLRRENEGGTLDTTALVHEAWVKLADLQDGSWQGRAHFFAFCSRAMRRILIDYARRRGADKRGGDQVLVPLSENTPAVQNDVASILELDSALSRLEKHNERMARIVECRFFGGMSVPETAEALSSSERTIHREWARARAYLHEDLMAHGN